MLDELVKLARLSGVTNCARDSETSWSTVAFVVVRPTLLVVRLGLVGRNPVLRDEHQRL